MKDIWLRVFMKTVQTVQKELVVFQKRDASDVPFVPEVPPPRDIFFIFCF